MIYSSQIVIPPLCPIQFSEPKEVEFYPYQKHYVGKLNVASDFMIMIDSVLYASANAITMIAFNVKTLRTIKTYTLTKHELSTGIYYAKCSLSGLTSTNQEIIMFSINIDDEVLADSLYYVIPKYTKNLKTIGYSNSENDWNTVFGDFRIDVECGFNPNDLRAKGMKEDYQEQDMMNKVIYSQPYSTEILSIGGNQGIPNWLYEKLNAIFMCDEITINGESYSVAQGADLEKIDQTYDGLARYKIELQKENNYAQ